jgi:hypothetical protein
MILHATEHYDQPLTADRLFGWHAGLFPSRRSGMRKIMVGSWRTGNAGPMHRQFLKPRRQWLNCGTGH